MLCVNDLCGYYSSLLIVCKPYPGIFFAIFHNIDTHPIRNSAIADFKGRFFVTDIYAVQHQQKGVQNIFCILGITAPPDDPLKWVRKADGIRLIEALKKITAHAEKKKNKNKK